MSFARRLFVPFIALAVAAPGLSAQEGSSHPVPAGAYRFVPEKSDEIADRIDQAVSHMNFLIRGIAKRRLHGANRSIDRVVVRYDADSVRISLREDEPWITSPRNGEFVPFTRPDGEVVQVRTQLKPDAINQHFKSDEGEKQMIYRLREDGLLALESIIHSDRLKEPFRYTWVFEPVKR